MQTSNTPCRRIKAAPGRPALRPLSGVLPFAALGRPAHRGTRASCPSQAGFTLIEMIVVIMLIAAIAAVVAGKVVQNKHRAEYNLAKTQLSSLAAQIDQYQADVGDYPESLDQLVTAPSQTDNWLGPYAKTEELKDPWHQPIEYRKPGAEDRPYSLTSLGVDRKAGGDGVDKDLVAP